MLHIRLPHCHHWHLGISFINHQGLYVGIKEICVKWLQVILIQCKEMELPRWGIKTVRMATHNTLLIALLPVTGLFGMYQSFPCLWTLLVRLTTAADVKQATDSTSIFHTPQYKSWCHDETKCLNVKGHYVEVWCLHRGQNKVSLKLLYSFKLSSSRNWTKLDQTSTDLQHYTYSNIHNMYIQKKPVFF